MPTPPKTHASEPSNAGTNHRVVPLRVSGSYQSHRELGDLELITLIRDGLPATVLQELANDLSIPLKILGNMLKAPQSTLMRIGSQSLLLQPGLSERVLGLITIFHLVTEAASESGHPNALDASPWLGAWLQTPVPALGGETPGHLLDTMTGVSLVTRVLNQGLQSVYA